VSEWLAVGYFAVLFVVSLVRPLPRARRLQVVFGSLGAWAWIVVAAQREPSGVRDWAPLVSITVGYFLSGMFFVRPYEPLERWLTAWDWRTLGDPATRFAHWPPAVLATLEVVYVGCFLLLPIGFAVIVRVADAAHADRFWTIVSAAEFGAFTPLAFIQTRPPWAVERPPAIRDRAVHRAAQRFVETYTIRVNTFPSGHAAVSVAIALAVFLSAPVAGALLLTVALAICVASVVGRYHYVVDIVAGVALAVAVFMLVVLSGV
jgi:membrane-associated phospholipid phosphatase